VGDTACGAEHKRQLPSGPQIGGKLGASEQNPLPCTLCNANPRALSDSSSLKSFQQLDRHRAAVEGTRGEQGASLNTPHAPSASPVPR
jgi:hypothetical protein